VKLVPTAFRRYPINFTSKAFYENQVEFTFFGINGYELSSRDVPDSVLHALA
jgi:hypothetical protein